jgi:hypothetical protein
VDVEDKTHDRDKLGDEMPAWVTDEKKRLAKIREAKAALEAGAKAAAEEKTRAEAQAEDKAPSRAPQEAGREDQATERCA